MIHKRIKPETIMSVIILVLSIVFYVLAKNFSNPLAAVWPRLVLVTIAVLSGILIVRGVRSQDKYTPMAKNALLGSMVSFAGMIGYVILMKFTGYFISTAVCLPIGMFALGQRRWSVILGVTAGLEVFIYILFVTQLQLRMP